MYSLDTLADLALVRIREKSLLNLQTSLGTKEFPWPSVEFESKGDSIR